MRSDDEELARHAETVLAELGPPPPTELEERVVGAIVAAAARGPAAAPRSGRHGLLAAVAAACLLVVGLGVAVVAVLVQDDPAAHPIPLVAVSPVAEDAQGLVLATEEGTTTRVRLELSGLPDASTGAPYEMWVTTIDGRRVEAAAFTAGSSAQEFTVAVAWADWGACGINVRDGSNDGRGTTLFVSSGYGAAVP